MPDEKRVLIIGLDGATWTVLTPWLDDGTLPHLARLRTEGCFGQLRSTLPPLTAPAWSSFLTGKNPGRHGVFHFVAMDDAPSDDLEARTEIVDARSVKSSTLWDIVAHQGRRVGSINVPMSYPPRAVNGFLITCLLTPPNAPEFTYPPDLSRRLADYQIDLDRFIDRKPFARDDAGPGEKRTVKPSLQLMREFLEMEEKRGRTALALMDSEPWDLFMVVFTATDRMGHYLWPYHHAEGLDGLTEGQELHAAIRDFYRRLDAIVGALVERAGPSATTIIMSDHGMGPTHSKNAHWNNWLYRRGYLKTKAESARTPDGWLLRLGLPRDRIGKLVRKIPILASSRAVARLKVAPTAEIDLDRSRAHYVRVFDPVGGIRVGGVGQEKRALRDELIAEIRALTDPDTGKSVVRWVFPREECYEGPYGENLPDIILVMNPEYGSSDRLSSYSAIVTDRPSIGDPGGHDLFGIFLARGPEIAPRTEPLAGLRIEDLAPTALHLMGLAVPTDLDGRVLTEILTPAAREDRPPITCPPIGLWPSEAAAVTTRAGESDEDEEQIRERLRALGYL